MRRLIILAGAFGLLAAPAAAQVQDAAPVPTTMPVMEQLYEEPTVIVCPPGAETWWGIDIVKYGISSPNVGQGLTLNYRPVQEGAPVGELVVTGGQEFSPAMLLVGTRPAMIPLPWEDFILVMPELVLPMGTFNQFGELTMPLNLVDPVLAGTTLYMQAVEELYIDPYPWSMHTSWGLMISFFNPHEKPYAVNNEHATFEVSFTASIQVMESFPPQYAVELEAVVPSTDFTLEHAVTRWEKGVGASVYFTLMEPANGEEVIFEPETVKGYEYLGQGLECERIRVFVNRKVRGHQYIVPPPFVLVDTFEAPCGSTGQ